MTIIAKLDDGRILAKAKEYIGDYLSPQIIQ
jgi:hypothetical protein